MADISGQINAGGAGRTVLYYAGNPAGSGNNTIVAADAALKIRVLACVISATGAVNAKFQSDASGTDISGLFTFAAAGNGVVMPYNPQGWFETAAAKLLNLNLSGATAVGVTLVYCLTA